MNPSDTTHTVTDNYHNGWANNQGSGTLLYVKFCCDTDINF